MRRIEVHLPPARFDELRDALADIGIDTMTLSEIKFVDPANRRREVYRGAAYVVDFALKVKVDLVVDDTVVPGVLRDSWIVLEAASWFLTAQIVFQVADGRVSVATFIRYDRPVAALVWPPLSVGHRQAMPGLLRHAAKVMASKDVAA